MRWLERSVYVLLGGLVAAGLVLTVLHAQKDVYAIPGYGVAIAVVAGVAAFAGIGIGWRAGRGRVVGVAALAGALAVVGVLSLPPVLLVVAALLAVAIRISRGERGALAIAAGITLGIGLHVVALIALSGPLVDCESGSAGENVFLGLTSHSSSGSGSASPDGTSRGRVRGDTYDYTYACRGAKLVEFELRHH